MKKLTWDRVNPWRGLAAMLALKPAETSSLRDARSLLGFALFAPFATFLLDQGPLSLALGLAAVVLTLSALQRLSDVESDDAARPMPGLRRLGSVGYLILLGLPLALAAFWLFLTTKVLETRKWS